MDTANVVLHVHAAKVQIVPGDQGKFFAADTDAGQGFQLNIGFRFGKAPFTARLNGAPDWVSAAISDDNKWIVITGTVPEDQPDGDVAFTVDVIDANGESASTAAAVPVAQ